MKKIPTIFDRDWNGDKSRVTDSPNPETTWVFDGEGVPTQKLDGTCCKIAGGKLYKRREIARGQVIPLEFLAEETDPKTGKTQGWMPVGAGSEDAYHREAFKPEYLDGTYELLGPKIQGNPERKDGHILVSHNDPVLTLVEVPRTYSGLREYLEEHDMEGIVFHHPDGRMAKIKARDFAIRRTPQ